MDADTSWYDDAAALWGTGLFQTGNGRQGERSGSHAGTEDILENTITSAEDRRKGCPGSAVSAERDLILDEPFDGQDSNPMEMIDMLNR